MIATTIQPTGAWMGRVRALVNCGERGPQAVAKFLPPKHDPDYDLALSHLVMADLRLQKASAKPSAWAEYRSHFPELPESEPANALDESLTSLRSSAIDLTQTPPPHVRTNATRVSPVDVVDLVPPGAPMPKRGERFGGFTLIDELGRGAFGRVYLAAEHNLADRPVALKVTRKPNRESQRLARLQHTNIVPIHNAFQVDGWHVLQMPYFGRQTLADLVETVREEKTFPKVSSSVFASTQMRASTTRKSTQVPASHPASVPNDSKPLPLSPEVLADHERQPSRELLVGLSYIDASIWLVGRMADGLAHAHAKGILHLDLKPHNVLLSDDGQPMLLDFNLSFDTTRFERDRVGGTWPYMSPEQICEYARKPGSPVDPRSDLYALGVIFFEMLTLRQPFAPVVSTDAGLSDAVANRLAGAPDVREFNPNVPPSIAAVVAKLLDPAPLKRYQTADELRDDLRRHGENRPLAHAKDRSIRERVTKWHRRNPRLSLAVCVAVLGLGLAFTAAQMMAWSKDRDRVAAVAKAGDFRKDHATLRLDLTSLQDAPRREAAIAKAKEWLHAYQVAETPDWADAATINLLSAAEQGRLRTALAETALLAAHAEWLGGRHRTDWEQAEYYDRARDFARIAQIAFGDNTPPALVNLSRELSGQSPDHSATISMEPADLFASAMREYAEGHYKAAAERLVKLTELQPDHFAGQFALAESYERIGQTLRACERFQVAKPLGPNDARPAFRRGIILREQGRLDESEADFNEALRREPGFRGAHLQRAFVRRERGNFIGALEDLTVEANAANGQKIMALAVRALVNDALDDKTAAAADRAAVDKLEPVTDLEYVARGARWLTIDPAKALADYDRALAINPDCYSALQNKAHVYYEELHEYDNALSAIERAVKRFPENPKVRMGHAVVLARLGRRAEAHAEANTALQLGRDHTVTFQAACVYALTSATHPQDRERGLAYLRQCLREGFRNWKMIQKDPDLDNLRGEAEFDTAISAAKVLVK